MLQPIEDVLPVHGPRVMLRDWQAPDADVVRHWHRPGHHWHTLNGPYLGEPTDEGADRIADRVLRIAAGDRPKVLRLVPIADAAQPERMLGTVNRYLMDETGWTAAGVALFDPETWNRGLGREALGLWVDLLFRNDPALHRLDLRTWSGNVGMMRVAERLGFTREARFREARVVQGARYDSIGFGMLRSEWADRQVNDRG